MYACVYVNVMYTIDYKTLLSVCIHLSAVKLSIRFFVLQKVKRWFEAHRNVVLDGFRVYILYRLISTDSISISILSVDLRQKNSNTYWHRSKEETSSIRSLLPPGAKKRSLFTTSTIRSFTLVPGSWLLEDFCMGALWDVIPSKGSPKALDSASP